MLSDDQCEEIFYSALKVMERTGAKIYDENALKLLKDAGAWATDGNTAHIPSALAKESLNTAPSRITVYDRSGKPAMFLEDHKIYFGTGSDCPFLLDSFTGERRKFTRKDVADAARIADFLPNIDFFMSMGLTSDVPAQTYDRHQFAAMLTHTTKPLVVTAMDAEGLMDISAMCDLVTEGEDTFRQRPFMVLYDEPSSPLLHSRNALRKLMLAAERGIPIIYTPCPIGGATATVTFAGLLVTTCAEFLTGLVLAQQVRKGAPIIIGGVVSIMDMATTIYSYGAPELSLLSAALTDLAHYLNLPTFSTAGCSDAAVVDQQAAIEATMSILTAALSGANLIHDVGFLEAAMTGSYDMVVMSDEIIGMVKQISGGMPVNEDTLAVEVIHSVGPGGHFLSTTHTLEHFRKTLWFPTLMNRKRYETWAKEGGQTMGDRIREKVRTILAEHRISPLPEEVQKGIEAILRRADRA